MDRLQPIIDFIREHPALQSIPPSWRLPIIGLVLFAVLFLVGLVMIVRSEIPPDAPNTKPMAPIAAPAPSPPNTVTDLFDPSDKQAADERRVTAVTEQIDNILLDTYILMHCKRMTNEDYTDIYQLLISYSRIQGLAHDFNEGDALIRKRASAVSGSFSMLYGNMDCDNERMMLPMQRQLDKWRSITRLSPVKQL